MKPEPVAHCRVATIGAFTAAVALPFLAGFNFIMNHFYVDGASMYDSGLFSALLWRPETFWLPIPSSMYEGSYYSSHFSPALYLIGLLSHAWPFGQTSWFAVFQGAILGGNGLLALTLFQRLMPLTGWRLALALFWSILFVFNGLALAILSSPHIEALGTLLACWFLLAFFDRKFRRAGVLLVFAAAVREDIGFHIVAILGLIWLTAVVSKRSLFARNDIVIAMSAALALSLAGCAIKQIYFPGDDAFARIYSGSPPWAHLTSDLLVGRLKELFVARGFFVYPALVAAVASFYYRSLLPLLGFLAYVPWLAINIAAVSEYAGRLMLYYPFPFQISFFWFLYLFCTRTGERGENKPSLSAVVFITLFLVSSMSTLIGWRHFTARWDARTVARAENAVQSLVENSHSFGELRLDAATVSLAPRSFIKDQSIQFTPRTTADTVIWHEHAGVRDDISGWISRNTLTNLYRISGTPFHIASRLCQEEIQRAGLDLFPTLGSNLLPIMNMRSGKLARNVYDLHGGGISLFGPYLPLSAGQYTATVHTYRFNQTASGATAEIYSTARGSIANAPLKTSEFATETTAISFTVPENERGFYEIRISAERGLGYRITGIFLERSKATNELATINDGKCY
ncbi:MAG TPA: hypothetical protein VNZ94_08870 [Xanthobacteraceae bacterium]|nr:hypothetical protein [Xanthobacteraceae bacterium]